MTFKTWLAGLLFCTLLATPAFSEEEHLAVEIGSLTNFRELVDPVIMYYRVSYGVPWATVPADSVILVLREENATRMAASCQCLFLIDPERPVIILLGVPATMDEPMVLREAVFHLLRRYNSI